MHKYMRLQWNRHPKFYPQYRTCYFFFFLLFLLHLLLRIPGSAVGPCATRGYLSATTCNGRSFLQAAKLSTVAFRLSQEVVSIRGCASWFSFGRKASLKRPDLGKSSAPVLNVLLHIRLGLHKTPCSEQMGWSQCEISICGGMRVRKTFVSVCFRCFGDFFAKTRQN